jgi:RNA polymerase sigma-70 factor (ECF subfamily)
VRARCGGQLRARLDSSDLVQETLLRVSQHIGQFEGACEAEWRAWLAQVAEHEVIHQYRHHLGAAKRAATREQRLDPPQSSANGGSRLEQWWSKSQSSPSQVAMRNERVVTLADALLRLADDYRQVLVLRHLEGLDFPEIAGRLGRSHGAVRVLWTRALKKLREELTRHETPEEGSCHA